MSPGFGYAGIVVAMLAALHPAGVVAAAVFVATVFVGRGRDEPGDGRAVLHRRRDRGAGAADDARGASVHQLPGAAMTEALDLLFNASLWAAVLRIATPLIFGVLGALLCERAGVLNLGIEGIMTMGAMVGWLSVFLGADLWTGLLIAAAAGALMGLLHAMLTVPLGLSQHVSGLGITLFASALAYYLYRLIVEVGESPPTIEPFRPLDIPVLSDIPFLGPVLFGQAAPTYLALIAVAVMAYVLNRTPLGLAIRMTGENPHAVEAQGLTRR
jgi:ABC-type uncharacterized transport system permease subunit